MDNLNARTVCVFEFLSFFFSKYMIIPFLAVVSVCLDDFENVCVCVDWVWCVSLSLLYSLKMKKTPIIVLSKRSFSLYETILYYRIDICTIFECTQGTQVPPACVAKSDRRV